MDVESQLPSRGEVVRMLRPHLPSLTAMAIDADHAAMALVAALVPAARLPQYKAKMRGQIRAVLWTESIRTWVETTRPAGVRVHDPYDWVELIFHGRLHVRVQTARYRPNSPRRSARNLQLTDQTLPIEIQESLIGNVDLNAQFSDATGALTWLTLEAPLKPGQLWTPVLVELTPGRRQLDAWKGRGLARAPWLEVGINAQRMSRDVALARFGLLDGDVANTRRVADAGKVVAPEVANLPAANLDQQPGWPASDQPRPVFGKNRESGRGAGKDASAQ